MILRPGDLVERTGAKMHRGQAGGSTFFFFNHKAYDDLWLRTSAFPTGRPPSSNHLFKDMGKWDQREMGEFPWSIVQYLIWYAYTCQLFLSQIREIFALSWTGFPKISQRRPKIPDDFPKTFRMWPKTSEDVPANFDHFRSHLKDDNLRVFGFYWDTKSSFNHLIGTFSWNLNWIFVINHVLKNSLFGFVS